MAFKVKSEMLPLIPLKACKVGSPLSLDEIVKKANEASERRKSSGAYGDGGELKRPERAPGRASDTDAEVIRRVEEREERVRDVREANKKEEQREAREREDRANALAAQREMEKARDALESDTDEGEESSSSSSSQAPNLDVSEEDERAMLELDQDLAEAEPAGYESFFTVEQLDSIYSHMEQALRQIERAVEAMPGDAERVVLFGVSTRLRADMRLILAIRNIVLSSRSPVVVPADLGRGIKRVDTMVKEASLEPPSGAGPVAWNRVLPVVGMLLYLLSVYLLPRAPDGESEMVPSRLLPEIVLTRPGGGLAATPLADNAATVTLPELSPSGRAKALARFGKACRRARS